MNRYLLTYLTVEHGICYTIKSIFTADTEEHAMEKCFSQIVLVIGITNSELLP
jgi:hypothetical protein